jgi:hypothetical protein
VNPLISNKGCAPITDITSKDKTSSSLQIINCKFFILVLVDASKDAKPNALESDFDVMNTSELSEHANIPLFKVTAQKNSGDSKLSPQHHALLSRVIRFQ